MAKTQAKKAQSKKPQAKKPPAKKPPAKPVAAKAVSLHIGLNEVSAAGYAGWTGPLAACEFDANDMAAIAKAKGMDSTVLLTSNGTRAKVLGGIRAAANGLRAGDLFFITYSGHGGQVHDVTGEEADKKDETWCLFDGQLIDDELYYELSRFKAGVRILVFSDSCHSGTVTRMAPPAPGGPNQRPKLMPREVAERTYAENKAFYDKLQKDVAKAAGKKAIDPDTALAQVAVSGRLTAIAGKFGAAAILISGCQDNQTSMDGDKNGAFTEQLLNVWSKGAFKGSYASFHAHIKTGLPDTQTPNLFTLGTAGVFLKQAPFAI